MQFFPCTVLFSRNIHDDSMPNIVLRVTANIVFGYATYVLLLLHMASSVYTRACTVPSGFEKDETLHVFSVRLWRCQDAEAFELSSSGFTNGVFVKFLKKRLLDDEKITVVLDRVAEGENLEDETWSISSSSLFQMSLKLFNKWCSDGLWDKWFSVTSSKKNWLT